MDDTDLLVGSEGSSTVESLIAAVQDSTRVAGLTHQFYRYPARFSPQFARAAIETFTRPGDVVVDPFAGGGTSVVEALASGRRAVGADLNPLSAFITDVKTTPLSRGDVGSLRSWIESLSSINLRLWRSPASQGLGYQRHVPWWLRKTLEIGLDSAADLHSVRQERFARAVLLHSAQWALDGRKNIPRKAEFLTHLGQTGRAMLEGIDDFSVQTAAAFGGTALKAVIRNKRVFQADASALSKQRRVPRDWLPAKLVLMSPPYRGVHILYHRWQINGRRETPAAYWLAGLQDGQPESFYTFGGRRQKTSAAYLNFARKCFCGILPCMDRDSAIVQLVGFNDPAGQLPEYLTLLAEVGLEEHPLQTQLTAEMVCTREVPNRRWYARSRSTAIEFLLVHRLAR